MKKLVLGLCSLACLSASVTAVAEEKIIVRETPVMIQKQGTTYVVPAGTSARYYTYTDNATQYVCTAEPVNVAGDVNVLNIDLATGTATTAVRCYPNNYFVIQAP